MRPLKLHEIVEEWLGAHQDYFHFFVGEEGLVRCPCAKGWYVTIDSDKMHWYSVGDIPDKTGLLTEDNKSKVIMAADPKFFEALGSELTRLHLKYIGEFRHGRSPQP